jgi:hypothetical protein
MEATTDRKIDEVHYNIQDKSKLKCNNIRKIYRNGKITAVTFAVTVT